MVSDPAALEAVTEGPTGVAAGLSGSAAVVQMSTVSPDSLKRLESRLPEGAGHAPVLGSLPEAEAGELRIFVGGPAELLERVALGIILAGKVL